MTLTANKQAYPLPVEILVGCLPAGALIQFGL